MLAIAHRCPTTVAGVAVAAAAGAQVYEVDVQSIDGVLVSSHFLPLLRGFPRLRRDRARLTCRARDVRESDLGLRLASLPADAQILLDLKADTGAPALALVELLARADLDVARCHVSTKGWHTLPRLAELGFRTWRTVGDAGALARVLRCEPVADYAVTVRHNLLDEGVLRELRSLAPRVMTWTVNDLRRARELAAWGVDGITTDSPSVLAFIADHNRGVTAPGG
ncbi:MAG: glycerophosphodiester phosphodiesterase [Sporichthyaceae bacterium]